MSIAEKITTIAENMQKVYEAGKDSENEAIWDDIQNYGKKTLYNDVFKYWAWKYANPRYKIENAGCNRMFGECTKMKSLNPEKFDFTNSSDLNYAFFNCTALENLPFIFGAYQYYQTFYNCKSLQSIGGIDFTKNSTNANNFDTFKKCTSLEDIGVIIGEWKWNNFDVSYCPLNHDTLMRFINCLADLGETNKTATFGADNLAKLTDEEKAIATERGWTLI